MEWTTPAFAFPAEAGTHLPTPEGWKAELALVPRTALRIRLGSFKQSAVVPDYVCYDHKILWGGQTT